MAAVPASVQLEDSASWFDRIVTRVVTEWIGSAAAPTLAAGLRAFIDDSPAPAVRKHARGVEEDWPKAGVNEGHYHVVQGTIWACVIPGGCTQFMQYMDVYFVARYFQAGGLAEYIAACCTTLVATQETPLSSAQLTIVACISHITRPLPHKYFGIAAA